LLINADDLAKHLQSPKRACRACHPFYSRHAYVKAICRACKLAGVPHWHPNQLRHTTATMIRAAYGLESAQAVLGHARADVTQIYAERDAARAAQVIGEIG
jgi:integrase